MKKTLRPTLLLLLIVSFIACKTAPPLEGIIEPFGIIGEGAAAYVYMPLKGNQELIEKVLPLGSANDMKQAFKRTDKIFSGIFFDGVSPEVRICTKGKYPYKFTGHIFKTKNGWHPKKTKEGYKYYESPFMDISIPSPLVSCIGLGNENRQSMAATLSKLQSPIIPKFSDKFHALQHNESGEIGIFVKQSDFFLAQILGVHLGLPLGTIEMYLRKDDTKATKAENFYSYDLTIEVENPRTAVVLKLFLRKLLGVEIKSEDSQLKIENRIIPESKIINIIKSLYPYK